MFDKFREECGVFGIFGHEEAARLTYLGLYALQHRGQESAGIVSSDGSRLRVERGMGHVNDIFQEKSLSRLSGRAAIGHVRYSTAGKVSIDEAQPFLVKCGLGQIALCHNGNLPDATEARRQLEMEGAIFSSTSDTEVVLHRIARSRANNLVDAIVESLKHEEGAFSMLFATPSSVIAVRDPRGFRPLCMGDLDGAIVFASETCAFDLIGATYIRDVEPGDIVVPVPDSGVAAAIGYASQSGLKFRFGLMRNHYVGRTFIEPHSQIRHFGVKIKLNPVRDLIEGKRVVLIDDSIVRGTTSKKIVKMMRDAGATEVHMRISCAPTIAPCYYGVDTPTKEELIAAQYSIEEIRHYLDADSLGYLSIKGMLEAVGDPGDTKYCTACYTGDYPTQIGSHDQTYREREAVAAD